MHTFYLVSLLLFSCPLSSLAQVLITEILFDPSPQVGLPPCEYVEFYNPGSDTIDLNNWIWQVGDKTVRLVSQCVAPNSCLVMMQDTDQLEAYRGQVPDTFEPPKWLGLRNSGDYLVLKNPEGDIIHFAEYSPMQYRDVLKRAGGWSLELTCFDQVYNYESWSVSMQPLGGSLGWLPSDSCPVSVFHPFRANRIGYDPPSSWVIHFNTSFHPASDLDQLYIAFGAEQVFYTGFHSDHCDEILLNWTPGIRDDMVLEVTIEGDIIDCHGQSLQPAKLSVGLPEMADSGNILISELMFNPGENGLEYVELYNPTGYIYELNDIILATVDEFGLTKDFVHLGSESFLLLPGQYVVVCADSKGMQVRHPLAPVESIHSVRGLPALNNSGGQIRLLNRQQKIIEQIRYDPSWHYPHIETKLGVSLERISFTVSGYLKDNWFSAAVSSGCATPGRGNSHQQDYQILQNRFQLSSAVFSPNQDGVNDFLLISIRLDQPGYMGGCEIRSLDGQLVKELLPWGLLPANGIVTWDGHNSIDNRVMPGIYVILINYNHPDGRPGRWKQACGIAWE